MKKLFSFVIFLLFLSPAFSANNNLVYSQVFPVTEIDNFDINLTYEDFIIESYITDEILVEVYSNNSRLIPRVETENDTLKIKSSKFLKGTKILIKIYIPRFEHFSKLDFSSTTTDPKISEIKVDMLNIKVHTGNITLNNIINNYMTLETVTGKIKAQKIYSYCFDIHTNSGDVFLDNNSEINAQSLIETNTGKIDLYLNEQSNFDIVFCSNIGKFINKWDFTEQKSREPLVIPVNEGGPELYLQTNTGNITLNERESL